MRHIAIAIALVGAAHANDYGTAFDHNTQSVYNWNTDANGTTRTNGYNARTGSTWQSQTDRNGNQSGLDSRGNYWQYNNQNKTYTSTDGTICTGQGAARYCTK